MKFFTPAIRRSEFSFHLRYPAFNFHSDYPDVRFHFDYPALTVAKKIKNPSLFHLCYSAFKNFKLVLNFEIFYLIFLLLFLYFFISFIIYIIIIIKRVYIIHIILILFILFLFFILLRIYKTWCIVLMILPPPPSMAEIDFWKRQRHSMVLIFVQDSHTNFPLFGKIRFFESFFLLALGAYQTLTKTWSVGIYGALAKSD